IMSLTTVTDKEMEPGPDPSLPRNREGVTNTDHCCRRIQFDMDDRRQLPKLLSWEPDFENGQIPH
ncbi:hypothetical protein P7K49_003573, partial [Saguinus oedipus]